MIQKARPPYSRSGSSSPHNHSHCHRQTKERSASNDLSTSSTSGNNAKRTKRARYIECVRCKSDFDVRDNHKGDCEWHLGTEAIPNNPSAQRPYPSNKIFYLTVPTLQATKNSTTKLSAGPSTVRTTGSTTTETMPPTVPTGFPRPTARSRQMRRHVRQGGIERKKRPWTGRACYT